MARGRPDAFPALRDVRRIKAGVASAKSIRAAIGRSGAD
jgi:hypothetical protein